MNDNLWRVSRFLVRYLWRPLENFGVEDPTRAAKNYKEKNNVDKRLSEWAEREGVIVIAGHTHRPVFPSNGEGKCFNDGSCVHTRCITAIEIVNGKISLVKWSIKSGKVYRKEENYDKDGRFNRRNKEELLIRENNFEDRKLKIDKLEDTSVLYIGKETLEGPVDINLYFSSMIKN